MPATLQTMSRRPKALRATASSAAPGAVRSAVWRSSSGACAIKRSSTAASRSTTITRAPAADRARAVALLIPPAPVTNAPAPARLATVGHLQAIAEVVIGVLEALFGGFDTHDVGAGQHQRRLAASREIRGHQAL